MSATLHVYDPGFSTTVQDLGRFGHARVGVGVSGAADPAAHRRANRLVGNTADSATLETTLGGLVFELSESRYVSITGAPVAVSVSDRRLSEPGLFHVPAGQQVRLGRPSHGLRSYVAVAGGLSATSVLGSVSTDTLSGIGPESLSQNSTLTLRDPMGSPKLSVPLELLDIRYQWRRPTIGFRWGPRIEIFDTATRQTFLQASWVVTTQTNRVGARLCGPQLSTGHLNQPSEGMVRGAIQIPPSGQPIVFLADHPTTGGYPVIGVVTDADIALVAQSPPNTILSFAPV